MAIETLLTCVANASAVDYAGWAVGKTWNGYGTILRSDDSGATWTRQGAGQIADVNLVGICAVDPLIAWAVGEAESGYASIYRTTDGGATWQRQGSSSSLPEVSLLKVHACGSDVWAVGGGNDGSAILHSGDAGATWTNLIPAEYSNYHLQGVYTTDGNTVWVTGGSQTASDEPLILKSTDAGLHWTAQTVPSGVTANCFLGVSAADGDNAWVVGRSYTLLSTTDGGTIWMHETSFGGLYDMNEVSALDASTVWVAADNAAYWTTDGGANWHSHTGVDWPLLGICAMDALHVCGVSSGVGAICYTTDGGANWTQLEELDGQSLPSMSTVSFSRQPVPEPAAGALLGLGLAVIAGRIRRRRVR